VVSDTADFHYKVTSPYSPSTERSLRWDDLELGITWPVEIGIQPIVSSKDAAAASFADCEKYD
jgi:dTDP-4-dehydrorhamnose 3,5-epimerase